MVDLLAVRSIEDRAAEFRAAGGDVLLLQAAGGIDALRCEQLAQVDGVTAAGAIRAAAPTFAAAAPSSSIPSFEVSPRFGALLDVSEGRAGVLLSNEAASMLGVSSGDPLRLLSGATAVGGVFAYPSDGRMLGLGYAMLEPTADTRPFDACWMRMRSTVDEHELLLQTVAEVAGNTAVAPEMRQLNTRLGARLDSAAQFEQRATRMLPVVAIVIMAGISAGAVFRRRLELASALHLGVTRWDLVAIVVAETGLWLVPSCVAALTTGAMTASALGADSIGSGLALAVLAPVGGVIGGIVGAAAMTASIRERDVYRAFKMR